MTERSVFEAFLGRIREGRPVALATVISGEKHVGSKMLLRPGESVQGSLGEAEVDAVVTRFGETLFRERRSASLDVGNSRVFVEVHLPAPRLIIVGAVHLAITLGRLAREIGFKVVVCDARDRFATPERFPEVDELILGWPSEVISRLRLDESSYVVVVTHDDKLDNPALQAALASPVPYIGALGSNKTHQRRLAALREAGVGERDLERIYSPIGLDIGARSPQEIALATLAEVVAVRNRVSGAQE